MSNLGNTASSYVGSAKETIGHAIGSEDLAAQGAAQRAAADTAYEKTKAEAQAAGLANKVTGALQENAGRVTGNTQLEEQGAATRGVGEVQQNQHNV